MGCWVSVLLHKVMVHAQMLVWPCYFGCLQVQQQQPGNLDLLCLNNELH